MVLLFYSCDKEEDGLCCADIVSDDGMRFRLSYTDKGYIEIEITPIIKNSCYFSDYEKEIFTPVSGLLNIMTLIVIAVLLILEMEHMMNGRQRPGILTFFLIIQVEKKTFL